MAEAGTFKRFIVGGLIMAGTLGLSAAPTLAGDAPAAPVASPEVYKIIAENKQFRVIEATWQPGQEDKFHSQPADRVSLFQTDCKLRVTKPDGTHRDAKPKAGRAAIRTGSPVSSHKAKNIGDKVCVIRFVELK